MSDSARALLIAAAVGLLILLGPLALLAAGVVEVQAMLVIQALILGGLYLAAATIKARREGDGG